MSVALEALVEAVDAHYVVAPEGEVASAAALGVVEEGSQRGAAHGVERAVGADMEETKALYVAVGGDLRRVLLSEPHT